ncbi:MAG: glycoside hydrolase family 3 N-terminal domain-containing protein [Bacteroidia bacterium]
MPFLRYSAFILPLLLLAPAVPDSNAFSAGAQVSVALPRTGTEPKAPPFLELSDTRWTDSVMKTLTPDQRIAQLFMVAAWSNKNATHVKEINTLISKYRIGGLIFMQGGPVRQAQLTNKYQTLSKVPLMIAMDAEWGLSMRIDSTVVFPRQMTLGAVQNDSLIYYMGRDMARQCKRIGVQISFSPVADVNNNAANPVIGTRSFGEDKYAVTRKATLYMQGLQEGNVLACGKHFPGHGDTDSDSHKTLPLIKHSKERLDSLELYPFKGLISSGIGSMMVAHLSIPAYDTAANTPTTLSKNVVTGLLREQLGFRGLVFTDALNMKGVSNYYGPGEVDVKALLAGNDVLLFSGDVPKALAAVKAAIARKEITQAEIDERCRRVLLTKQWLGLTKKQTVKLKNLVNDLNTPASSWLNHQLAESAVTLLRNENQLLPLQRIDTCKIASVTMGSSKPGLFHERLAVYATVTPFALDNDCKPAEYDTLLKKLTPHNVVVLALSGLSQRTANNFNINTYTQRLADTLHKMGKTVIADVFGSAYAANQLPALLNCNAVIMSYESLPALQDVSAQLIFGGVTAQGKLPVSLNGWKAGTGLTTPPATRFRYVPFEAVGFSRNAMKRIDSIMAAAIEAKAFPGGQLFAAKNGNVFLMKSYGHFTYAKKHAVNNMDLYDVASVTKIVATTPLIMQKVESGQIKLDTTLSTYLPELTNTNKRNIKIRRMMAHQSGLEAWIPFWTKTVDKNGVRKKSIYRTVYSDSFPIYVAPGIFMKYNYLDSMYAQVVGSGMSAGIGYKYSDLCFFFLKRIIERQEQMLITDYVNAKFYHPLGLPTIGYQPGLRFPASRCAPTENDLKFRGQLIQGDVHDPGAAMQGGIGGHAGVFSNANDAGVIMQLFLNGGSYGGMHFFDSATVNEFTRYQYSGNRRGLGFDKPDPETFTPACEGISLKSYGHQGFTGTQVWADPETGIVFVFLSNRVYPDAEDNKLARLGVRGKVLKVILNGFKRNDE